MTDKFWRRMARANASLFMMAALIVLLGVLVWVLRPRHNGVMKFGSAGRAAQGRQTDGSNSVSHTPLRLESGSLDPGNNPFSSVYLERLIEERLQAERLAREEAAAKAAAKDVGKKQPPSKGEEGAAAAKAPAPAKKPEPPRTITLVYRGMMTKLDGTRLALVDIPAKGASAYHEQGAEIGWLKIESFTPAVLKMTDGEKVYSLRRGVSQDVKEDDAP